MRTPAVVPSLAVAHTDWAVAVRILAAVLAGDLAARSLVAAPTLALVRTGWARAVVLEEAVAVRNLAAVLEGQIPAHPVAGIRRVAAAAVRRDLVAPVLRESERSRRDRKDSSRGEGVDQTDRQEEP